MENLKQSIFNPKFPKKQALTTIALILLLTLTALLAGMQSLTVNAQGSTGTIQSYAFIVANPNPVGVGQQVYLDVWVADPLPSAATGIGQFRTGYTISVTKPDNTTTDITSSFVNQRNGAKVNYEGGSFLIYTPAVVGNYVFKFNYAGDTIYSNLANGARNWNDTTGQPLNPNFNYTATPTSATITLVVREEQSQNTFQVPYPTQYWTRPINNQNYFWGEISSNWLMTAWNSTSRVFDNNAAFVPEGKMANSPHILWTKPIYYGGLAGGIYRNIQYYSGLSYEMYTDPQIIIGGRFFHTTIQAGEPRGLGGPFNNLGTECIDLQTGQTLYVIPNATMSYGQILNFPGVNQAGTFAYLWSSGTIYDPWTGDKVIQVANMTSGVATFGKNGEIIIYGLANNSTFGGVGNPSYQLTMWNSTRAIESYQVTGTGTVSQDYSWRPYTTYNATQFQATIDGNRGIQWRVPAYNVSGFSLTPFLQMGGLFDGNNILAYQSLGTANPTNVSSTTGVNITEYDMTTGAMSGPYHVSPDPNLPYAMDGIAAFENIWEFNGHLYSFNHYTLQWSAYDIKTNKVMWTSNPLHDAWGHYNQAASLIEAYGLTIFAGFDGYANGYNTTTGQLVWEYFAGDSGFITPYGHYTFYDGITVVDGKIILLPNEHGSGIEPLYQNMTMTVLDARTGKLVWSVLGYYDKIAIADGIMISHNNYDNNLYAFGKGPSQTTVEAPLTAINAGSSMIIQGTVTDQSVGALNIAKTTGVANVPAISDSDQADWMAQLYMQQPGRLKQNATGVPVLIRALDSSNAIAAQTEITSDILGNFAFQWTPTTPGMYTIVASFPGTESYYGSFAETHVAVQSAPSASPAQTPSTTVTPPITTPPPTTTAPTSPSVAPTVNPGGLSATDMYLIGVAVVVAIVVIAAAVLLRRRK